MRSPARAAAVAAALLIALAGAAAAEEAPPVVWNWTENPSGGTDALNTLSVDSSGNIYAGGYDSIPGNAEWRVVKLYPNGTTAWNWTQDPSGSDDLAYSIALDSSGNIYVAGRDLVPGNNEWRVVKLYPNGTTAWNWTQNPSGTSDVAWAIGVDSADNIVVGGQDDTLGNLQWRVTKLYPNGTVAWNWTQNPSGGFDVPNSVALDSSGNIYVAGYDEAPGVTQWRVVKLYPNGTAAWNWTQDPSASNDIAYSVTLDSSGNIYTAGYDLAPGNYEWRVVKIYPDGTTAWNWTQDPSASNDIAYSVAVDSSRNIYAAGRDAVPGNGEWRVVKMYPNGTTIWNWTLNFSSGLNEIYSIALDSSGDIYAGGLDNSPGNPQWRVVKLFGPGTQFAGTLPISSIPDGNYTLYVNATDNAGNSNNTTNTTGYSIRIDRAAPASVSNLVNASGLDFINWTWTNPGGDFDHTEVWVNGSFTANSGVPYYNRTGLSPNVGATISLRTVDALGNVNATWANSTAYSQAAVPAGLAVTAPDNRSIQVSWDANGNPGGTYYQSFIDGFPYPPLPSTSFGDTFAPNATNTSHTVFVRALNGDGIVTANTSPVSNFTLADRPLNLAATAVAPDRINLSWSNATNPPGTEIDVFRNGVWVATVTNASYPDSGLNASTSYTYVVGARNGAGMRNNSTPANAVTQAAGARLKVVDIQNNSFSPFVIGETDLTFRDVAPGGVGACASGALQGIAGTSTQAVGSVSISLNFSSVGKGLVPGPYDILCAGAGTTTVTQAAAAVSPVYAVVTRSAEPGFENYEISFAIPGESFTINATTNLNDVIAGCAFDIVLRMSGTTANKLAGKSSMEGQPFTGRTADLISNGTLSLFPATDWPDGTYEFLIDPDAVLCNGVDGPGGVVKTLNISASPPSLLSTSPPSPVVTDVTEPSPAFSVMSDQPVNVTWLLNGTVVQVNGSGGPPEMVWNWTQNVTGWDWANSVALDSSGNVYAAGFDSIPGNLEWRVTKLYPNGTAAWNWTQNPSALGDVANAITIDPSGNLYVAGYDTGAPSDNQQWRVVKLYPNLTTAWNWTTNPSTINDDWVYSVTVDSSGNIYAAGYNAIDGGCCGYDRGWRVTKLYPNGTEAWNWTANLSLQFDIANSVAVDFAGNIYAVGYDTAPGNDEWRVTKFYPNGTTVWNWTENPSAYSDVAYSVAVDSANNIYVAGYDAVSGSMQWRVVKLYPNGTTAWNWTQDPSGDNDAVYSVALDSAGNIYAAGFDYAPGNGEWRVTKLYPTGTAAWSWTGNPGTGWDVANSVAVDSSGNIYAAGLDTIFPWGGEVPMAREWRVVKLQPQTSDVTTATYTNTTPSVGLWNVTASAGNANGDAQAGWLWRVLDNVPPAFGLFGVNSSNPNATDVVSMSANWTDNVALSNFTFFWSANGPYCNNMSQVFNQSTLLTGATNVSAVTLPIPPACAGRTIQFSFAATDSSGNSNSTPPNHPNATINVRRYGVAAVLNNTSAAVEPFQNATFRVTINNTGNRNDSFNLSLRNPDNANRMFLDIPGDIYLPAFGNATRNVTVNAARPGTFHGSLNVSSLNRSGVFTIVGFTANVVRTLEVIPDATHFIINTTQNATFNLTVRNVGLRAHAFTLTLTPVNGSGLFNFSGNATTSALQPGEAALLSVIVNSTTVSVPPHYVLGAYVNETAENRMNATLALTTVVTVANVSRVGVSVNRTANLTETGEFAFYGVTIKNTGNTPDSFTLNLAGNAPRAFLVTASGFDPNAGGPSAITVSLNPGEANGSTLAVRSNTTGAFVTLLAARSANANNTTSVTTTVVSGIELTAVPAALTVNTSDNANYTLTVKNNAARSHTYWFVNSTDPATAAVNLSNATSFTDTTGLLAPGASVPLTLTVNAANPGAYTTNVTAYVDAPGGARNATVFVSTLAVPRPVCGVRLTVTDPAPEGDEDASQTVEMGANGTYILALENLGNAPDIFNLTVSRNPRAAAVTLNEAPISETAGLLVPVDGAASTDLLLSVNGTTGAYPVRVQAASTSTDTGPSCSEHPTDDAKTNTIVHEVDEFSTVESSTVSDHASVKGSKVSNASVGSVVQNSTIQDSVVSGAEVYNSFVYNSTLADVTVDNVTVDRDVVTPRTDPPGLRARVVASNVEFDLTGTTAPVALSALVNAVDSRQNSLGAAQDDNLAFNGTRSGVNLTVSATSDIVGGSLRLVRSTTPPWGVSNLTLANTTITQLGGYVSVNASSNIKTKPSRVRILLADALDVTKNDYTIQTYNAATGQWVSLTGCAAASGAENYVECDTPHFSIFAVTGSLKSSSPPAQTTGGGSSGGGAPVPVDAAAPKALEAESRDVDLKAGEVSTAKFRATDVAAVALKAGGRDAQVRVTVKKLDSMPKDVPLPLATTYGVAEISTDAPDRIAEAKVTLRIPQKWLDAFNVDLRKVSLQRWAGGKWTPIATTPAGQDGAYFLFESGATPGFSYFAITVEKRAPLIPALPGLTVTVLDAQRQFIGFLAAGAERLLDFARTDVFQIVMRLKTSVTQLVLEVQKLAGKPAEVPAAPDTAYNYFTVRTLNFEEDDLAEASIGFKVDRAWMQQNQVDPASVALNRFNGERWVPLPTERLQEQDGSVLYRAQTPGFSIFVLVDDTEPAARVSLFSTTAVAGTAQPPPGVPEIPAPPPPSFPLAAVLGLASLGAAVGMAAVLGRLVKKQKK